MSDGQQQTDKCNKDNQYNKNMQLHTHAHTHTHTHTKQSRHSQIIQFDLVVTRTRLQLGNRAFCVAVPVAWDSLPLDSRSAPTLSTFKNMLKTHLFSRSYFTKELFPE